MSEWWGRIRLWEWRAGLALVALIAVGIFGIIQKPHEQAPQQPSQSTQSEVDPRTAEERIADYTLWLERFTALLAIVSATQIWFLIRADRTARISADAAKDSAERLIRVDRPYLYFGGLAAKGSRGVALSGKYEIGVTGTLINCGSRTGFIRNMAVAYLPAKELNPIPPEPKKPTMANFKAMRAGTESTLENPILNFELEPTTGAEIQAKTIKLFVYGYIRYSDVHGVLRRSGFAYQFHPSDFPGMIEWVLAQCGPASYWYDVEESKSET